MTGPGPSHEIAGQDRVSNLCAAEDYWKDGTPEDIVKRAMSTDEDDPAAVVVVIGAGGAAATIAKDLCSRIPESEEQTPHVIMIAPQPSLFTRGESRAEVSTLTDGQRWKSLSEPMRERIRMSLVSGVISPAEIKDLDAYITAERISVEPGRVLSLVPTKHGTSTLLVERPLGTIMPMEATVVINARGFDALSTLRSLVTAYPDETDLLPEILRRVDERRLAQSLDDALRPTVATTDWREDDSEPLLPHLHLPMLAGRAQPPGLSSLLCLGELSERILTCYFRNNFIDLHTRT